MINLNYLNVFWNRFFIYSFLLILFSLIIYIPYQYIYASCKIKLNNYERFELHSYKYEEDGAFKMQIIDNRNKVKYYYKCHTIPFTKKEIEDDFMQVVIWERPENVKYIKD